MPFENKKKLVLMIGYDNGGNPVVVWTNKTYTQAKQDIKTIYTADAVNGQTQTYAAYEVWDSRNGLVRRYVCENPPV